MKSEKMRAGRAILTDRVAALPIAMRRPVVHAGSRHRDHQ
jgi:hypothetical protein